MTTPERERQQRLLHSLFKRDGGASLGDTLRGPTPKQQRGWQVYAANAGAAAESALAATYPTVRQLVGEESFAALARAYWQAEPPSRGDLAWVGETWPDFIAASTQLADVPYLADCARLDAALAHAERAADGAPALDTLAVLGEHDPEHLHIVLRAGSALIDSPWPVVSLWLAHHRPVDPHDAFAPVRAALAEGWGECALVHRQGWRAEAVALDPLTARFTQALLRGCSLSQALGDAGEGFDFEAWLIEAVQQGHIAGVARRA